MYEFNPARDRAEQIRSIKLHPVKTIGDEYGRYRDLPNIRAIENGDGHRSWIEDVVGPTEHLLAGEPFVLAWSYSRFWMFATEVTYAGDIATVKPTDLHRMDCQGSSKYHSVQVDWSASKLRLCAGCRAELKYRS